MVPSRLRRLAGLAEGEQLDITLQERKLVIERPSRVRRKASRESFAPNRAEFLQQLRNAAPEALKRLWDESERKGLDKVTARQIDGEITKYRKERRKSETVLTQAVR